MSSKTRRAVSLPPPPPSPPLSTGNLSPSFDCEPSLSRSESNQFLLPDEMNGHREIVIGKDLCRAIRELQAVPSLKWPTRSLEFDDFIGFVSVDDDCVFVNRADLRQDEQLRRLRKTKIDENDQLDYCNGSFSTNVESTSSVRTTSSSVHSYIERTTTNISVTKIDSREVGCRVNEAHVPEALAERASRSDSQTSDYGSLRRMQLQTTTRPGWNSTNDNDSRRSDVQQSEVDVVETVRIDDGVWNGFDVSTVRGSHQATNRRNDGVERFTVTSGTAVTSVSEFSDDYDIYEKQMDELELLGRGAIDTDDDYETDLAFDSTADDERCSGSYTVGLNGIDTDGRLTNTSSILGSGAGSCSNFSSGGVDAIAETDWTSPPDSIHLSDVVDWEEIVSEKERFVRSVLMNRKQKQQSEGENFGYEEHRTVHSGNSTVRSTELSADGCVHHDTDIAISETDHQLDGGRHKDSGDINRAMNSVSETLITNFVVEEIRAAPVFEQRSTVSKTSLMKMEQEKTAKMEVSTDVHCDVGQQLHEGGSTSVAPTLSKSVRYQLNIKPEKIKAISLESFMICSTTPRTTCETPVPSDVVDGSALSSSPVADIKSPSVETTPAILLDGINAIDFTAEELFEEIMESLSDAAVPDVDDNDDDFIDRSIKFWFSSPVIVSSDIDGRISVSPKPTENPELRSTFPVLSFPVPDYSQSAEQLHLASVNQDYGNLNRMDDNSNSDENSPHSLPKMANHDQQVPASDDRIDKTTVYAHIINNTTSSNTITHDFIAGPTPLSVEAGATVGAQSSSGTEGRRSSSDSAAAVAAEAISEETTVENTKPKASVKSLLTYFERQSFVQISSSPAKVTPLDQTGVIGDSDDDLDSVVSANVSAAHDSLSNDIDGCLDGLVDLNRQVVDVAGSKSRRTAVCVDRPSPTVRRRYENTVSTLVSASSSCWQRSYDDGCNVDRLDQAEQNSSIEKAASIRLESAHPGSDIKTRVLAEEERTTLGAGEDTNVNEAVECHEEIDGEPEEKLSGPPSSDVTHSEVTNDEEVERIHSNGTLMPNTNPVVEQGTIKILSDELTTQEIVLIVRLPRTNHLSKSARSQQPDAGAAVDNEADNRSLAVQVNGVAKIPFRHLNVRRVVRVIDEVENSQAEVDISGSNRSETRQCGPIHREALPTARRVVEIQTFPVTTATETNQTSSSVDDVVPLLVGMVTGQRVHSALPINVELDRKARSSAIEYISTDGDATNEVSEVSVIREDAIRVVRLPGSHADSIRLPSVTPINDTLDRISLALRCSALPTPGDKPEEAILPAGVRVTCEAFERHETLMTSSGGTTPPPVGELIKTGAECSSDGNTTVTVVRRTLFPLETNSARDDVTLLSAADSSSTNCAPTVTSFP